MSVGDVDGDEGEEVRESEEEIGGETGAGGVG